MRFLLTSLLIFLLQGYTFGQENFIDTIAKDKKMELSFLAGFNQGKYSFIDAGLAINKAGATGIHSVSLSYSVSNEFKLGTGKIIIGPKVGVWTAGGPAVGFNLIYYTDFTSSSLTIRPEIGFGITSFKLVYGYNWLLNSSFAGVNKSLVGLTYCF